MNMQRLGNLFMKVLALLLLAFIVLPVFGAEETETPLPPSGNGTVIEDIIESSDGDVTISNPDNTWLQTIIVGMSGLLVGISLIVMSIVAIEGMRAAKVNIPPEFVRPYVQPILDTVQGELHEFQENARQTTDPIDDLIGNLVALPFDKMQSYLADRGYIVIKQDDTLADIDVLDDLDDELPPLDAAPVSG